MQSEEKIPVWLDCDPGHDDACAIILAGHHPKLELLGISTVMGNQTVDKTTQNALKVTAVSGLEHIDCKRKFPDITKSTRTWLLILTWQKLWTRTLSFTCTKLLPPRLPRVYPDVVDHLDQIVVLGGAMGIGNMGPVMEWNILVDPEAAKIVFECGLKIVQIPIDVTHKVLVTEQELDTLRSWKTPFADLFVELLLFFEKTYREVFNFRNGPPLHDPLAVAYVIDPELFETKLMRVDVETQSSLTSGQTICDVYNMTGREPNIHLATQVNRNKFWELMMDAFATANKFLPNQHAMFTNHLLSYSFNQDGSCFSVGTESGFVVYDTHNMGLRFRQDFGQGVRVVEPFRKTNLVALVGGGKHPKWDPKKVVLWDDSLCEPVAQITCDTPICGIKFTAQRLFVILEHEVYEYEVASLKLIKKYPTIANPTGLCVQASTKNSSVIVIPDDNSGRVRIIQRTALGEIIKSVQVAEHPVVQIALNRTGTRLATCSENGKVIRVWDVANMTPGNPLMELERGAVWTAQINCLAFSPDASILILTSQTGTVHVFNLETPPDQGLGSWISLSSWRGRVNSVARFNIPEADSICCVPSVTKYKEAEIVLLSKSQNETEARYYKYLYRDSTKTCDQLTAEYLLKEDIITT